MLLSQKKQALRHISSAQPSSKTQQKSRVLHKTPLNLLYLLCLSAFSSSTYAGPELNFTMTIVKPSCGVSVTEEIKNVDLGTIAAKSLRTEGERSIQKPIKFVLTDCPQNGSVYVRLSGKAIPTDANLLQLSPASNSATNVAIEFSNEKNQRVKLNQRSEKYIADNDGNLTINYNTNYYALGPSTAGIANATASFLIEYD